MPIGDRSGMGGGQAPALRRSHGSGAAESWPWPWFVVLLVTGCHKRPPQPPPRPPVTSCDSDLSGTWVAVDAPTFRYAFTDDGKGVTIQPLFDTAAQVGLPSSAPAGASQPAEALASYSTHVYHLRRTGEALKGSVDFTVTSTRGKTCPVSLLAQIDTCKGTIMLWSDRGADVTWATCRSDSPGQLNGTELRRE